MDILDNRYQGFDLPALQEWLAERADADGRVDLVVHGLPEPLRDAWLPDPEHTRAELDIYPQGGCVGTLSACGDVSLDYKAQGYNHRGGEMNLRRRFDTQTGRVDHGWFWLPREEWGAGHGRRLMRRSAELYLRLGLASVHLTAIQAGKFVWPMCGFQTDDPEEHGKTLDTIRRLFGHLGFEGDLPRFDDLWELEMLDVDEDGCEVLVAVSDIQMALALDGRSFEIAAVAEPTVPALALSKALLLYNATAGWPGVLILERGSKQLTRLADYTGTNS
jgi:GNAT superfamily N-acetyltransferase